MDPYCTTNIKVNSVYIGRSTRKTEVSVFLDRGLPAPQFSCALCLSPTENDLAACLNLSHFTSPTALTRWSNAIIFPNAALKKKKGKSIAHSLPFLLTLLPVRQTEKSSDPAEWERWFVASACTSTVIDIVCTGTSDHLPCGSAGGSARVRARTGEGLEGFWLAVWSRVTFCALCFDWQMSMKRRSLKSSKHWSNLREYQSQSQGDFVKRGLYQNDKSKVLLPVIL